MNIGFPRIDKSRFTGEIGVNLVSKIINNEIKWIFRKNSNETDFGIDAYTDIVTEEGNVTGQSIAIQIKSGPSFFKRKAPNGYTYYGDPKHLNYYSNLQIPLILVICDIEKDQCYWQNFNIDKVELTSKAWKINIPTRNVLDSNSKNSLLKLLPPIEDYASQIEEQAKIDELLYRSDLIAYTIDREDIEENNILPIKEFFLRLQRNDNLFRSMQGRVELNIHGYDFDKRELYEIKQVKRWFKKAHKKLDPWFFFLNMKSPAPGFLIYWGCVCKMKVVSNTERMNAYEIIHEREKTGAWPQLKITFDQNAVSELIKLNFHRLNQITDKLGMSMEENKRITFEISDAIKSMSFSHY